MVKSSTSNRRNIIFVGLVLGMLVAATNQTFISQAMPVIVAHLGGIEHYSWIATSTLLAVAVSVPVVGKLSDIYRRRGLYIGGRAARTPRGLYSGNLIQSLRSTGKRNRLQSTPSALAEAW